MQIFGQKNSTFFKESAKSLIIKGEIILTHNQLHRRLVFGKVCRQTKIRLTSKYKYLFFTQPQRTK